MIRITVMGIGLIMLLAACGAPLNSADSTDGQPSATVEHGSADATVEQRAIEAIQKQFRFDGSTTTILSRPLTNQEVSDLWCAQYCASRSGYYVLILEGEFHSLTRATAVPTFVPNRPYRFVGAIIDLSSGSAIEQYASSGRSDIRVWFQSRFK